MNLAVPYRQRKRIKEFYSIDENGARNVETERWFAQLENRIAPLITELVSSRREPTEAEKTRLAVFMGTMCTRTPLARQLGDERSVDLWHRRTVSNRRPHQFSIARVFCSRYPRPSVFGDL